LSYNPVYGEELISTLLTPAPPAQLSGISELGTIWNFTPQMQSVYEILDLSQQRIEQVSQNIRTIDGLISRLGEIGFANSVEVSLRKLKLLQGENLRVLQDFNQQLSQRILEQEKTFQEVSQRIAEANARLNESQQEQDRLNSFINQLEFSLAALSRRSGDSGFIVDSRDHQDILLYVLNREFIVSGIDGLVFREDNRLIGKIVVTGVEPRITARLVELQEGEQLQPFDAVVFNLQQPISEGDE
jgi:vacuolar-type H+-ATPase subunit I/STV1